MFRNSTDYGSPTTSPFRENTGHNVTPPANYPVHKYPKYSTYRACPPRFAYSHMFRGCNRLIDFRLPAVVRNPPMPRYWRRGHVPTVHTATWDPRMRLTAYEMLLRWIRTRPIDQEKGILHWLWEAKKDGVEPGIVEFDWVTNASSGPNWGELKQWLVEQIAVEKEHVKMQDFVFDENSSLGESSDGSQCSSMEGVVIDKEVNPILTDQINDVNELDELDWKEFSVYTQKRTGVGCDLELKARLDRVAQCNFSDDGSESDQSESDDDSTDQRFPSE
ncbi:uncharacterized protein LAJ45_09474 [Morchella importuna]|uniref:uncharacterized protein n=1 Tax=Morchella importuna TaxID=1174673 RepID=UPI001E8E87E2|nr:uncharacterized protein LAJ45_09474 [Morchella importuna]KAH8146528.1 hypothetical protein LAJ45_09474 [Morchella importuna]